MEYEYAHEIKEMCSVRKGTNHDCAPIPQEGKWTSVKEVNQINGFTNAVGGCAPQQGACKLTLNIKNGIIEEALIETIGCSGMTHSACMAGEILPGRTVLEALNTDLVCDAINTAMREAFLQIAYGRSQSAYSEGGLPVGASMEDLGKGKRSQIGTVFSSRKTGPRYLENMEGYILELGLDENDEIIGYKYINIGKFFEDIEKGVPIEAAFSKGVKTYGRFDEAVKKINPRKE
ncbi:MAG TPA: hypothetical protein GXZ61_00945 [Clostridiales bacterium]|jgi:NifU-like protein involved in Fe-S cluster formation|nr:hypothetical protein [Clostridiales bacterium]